jgi:diadenosine tetraphosphate (Ap4A) HIT family hydrolase
MQSNGRAAWQSVFHYHVHLIPVMATTNSFRCGDGLDAELDALLARISD